MHVFYSTFICCSLITTLFFAHSNAAEQQTAQNTTIAARIAQKEAEVAQKQQELKDLFQELEVSNYHARLENKKIFQETGNGAGCDFTDIDLSSAVAELNKKNMPIDLSGANLTRAKVISVNLKKTNFTNANLTKTSFYKSDLTRANLTGAKLSGTDFESANLSYAMLHSVSLKKLGLTLNLKHTNMDGVKADKISDAQLHLLHHLQNMFGK